MHSAGTYSTMSCFFFCYQKNFHGKNNDILKHLSNDKIIWRKTEFFYFATMTVSVCPYQLFVYPTTGIHIVFLYALWLVFPSYRQVIPLSCTILGYIGRSGNTNQSCIKEVSKWDISHKLSTTLLSRLCSWPVIKTLKTSFFASYFFTKSFNKWD